MFYGAGSAMDSALFLCPDMVQDIPDDAGRNQPIALHEPGRFVAYGDFL